MGQRPADLKPPAHWGKSPPVPTPEPLEPAAQRSKDDPLGRDPTRYGDWELKGVAVDF